MLQNVLFYLFLIYIGTFLLGKVLQNFRIPWIFASLLVGVGLSLFSSSSSELLNSEAFQLMAQLGLYFLLFIIGFSINLKETNRQREFYFKTTSIIILGEAFVGTLLVHALFDISWWISMLVALSFATVGEAVLLPILEEFKLVKKPLGQVILNIGVLDDIFEVATIILVSLMIGFRSEGGLLAIVGHLLLAIVIILSPLLVKYIKNITNRWSYGGIDNQFLGSMALLFLFIWAGSMIGASELAALMAGVVLSNTIPKNYKKMFTSDIHTIAYGFFAPVFFVSVGLATEFSSLGSLAGVILLISIATATTKIVLTYFTTKERLGSKQSIIAGISLTVRMSTSIVIIKILLDNGIIPNDLYTVLVGTTIVFKFINPVLISFLIQKWGISEKEPLAKSI